MQEGNKMDFEKRNLLEVLKLRSVSYGDFTLSSGKKSFYYVDAKLTTYDPEGIILIGKIIYEMIEGYEVTAIGGLTMGADPICISTIMAAFQDGKRIKGFSVRKKAKEHGKMKQIEGNLDKSDRVVMIDDVMTTGSSTIQAIKAVEEFGAKIVLVVALVDRCEGGKENISKLGYKVDSLYTISDLIDFNKRGKNAKKFRNTKNSDTERHLFP